MKAGLQVLKRALALLSERERKKLYGLAIAVVGMSFMELFGVVSILPFMNVATNPEVIHSNTYLSWAFKTFNFQSENRFLLALGSFALFAMVVGNIFRAFSRFLLLRFAHMQNHHLGRRVLKTYLYRPYEYFLSQNSSDLSKTVLSEVSQLVGNFFVPVLMGFGRLCTSIFIVLMLVVVDLSVALVMSFVIGGSYVGIYKFLKRKITSLGEQRVKSNQSRFRLVNEVSGGIKEVKLMNREETYLKEFNLPSLQFAHMQAHNAVLRELPKYILEIVAFGGILSLVLYFIATKGQSAAISLTALYAFAGYKLLPALQEVFGSLTKVRFSLPGLRLIEKSLEKEGDIQESIEEKLNPIHFTREIQLKNISFKYPGASLYALQNISFSILNKSTVGIVGPTGSGKTTLVDIILGLLRPREGEILIDGERLNKGNLSSWQSQIGYVPQAIYLSDKTIKENIAFGVPQENIDMEQVRRASQLAQIHNYVESQTPSGYETVVGERGVRLSGGQRQRIGVARALYHDPKLLVFDEATSALDTETETALVESIERLSGQKTIIMIAHRTSTLKRADQILRIKDGKLSLSQKECLVEN